MSVNRTDRSNFFPTTNRDKTTVHNAKRVDIKNNSERKNHLEEIARSDAKIEIPNSVKDFAKIKLAVDQSTPVDNSAKIAELKAKIEAGLYDIDYDALADKIIEEEMS